MITTPGKIIIGEKIRYTTGGGSAPTNNTPPSISGTAVVGQTLTVTAGGWSGSPTPTLSYQWYRGATPISGATSTTYTLVQADAGQNIKCTVTGTNSAGSASADSNTVAILATLLDLYPSAAAAYSVRLLRGAYLSSPAIRVRRSNDNAETDIGFTTSGDLDTSALTAFVGSNNGFIVTWYDQSDNGINFTQTTPSNQPKIINAGVLLTENGLPSIRMGAASIRSNVVFGSTTNIFSIFKNYDTVGTVFSGTTAGNDFIYAYRTDSGAPVSGATISQTYTNGILRTITSQTTVLNTINTGALLSFTSLLTSVNVSRFSNLQLGVGALSATDISWSELILYPESKATDRVLLETNQMTYYGII